MFGRQKNELVSAERALPGRGERPFPLSATHLVLGTPLLTDTVPDEYELALFGLGCFWGAEEIFWQVPGVWSTSVGYAGGTTPNPSYEEVCSGLTNHTEAVRIVFDPAVVSYADLVKGFFEVHDPTQGMRQGNDIGTQYRSAIFFTSEEQRIAAEAVRARIEASGKWKRPITTEIAPAGEFWSAEAWHQDYLEKNPGGYTCHYLRDYDFTEETSGAARSRG